MTGELRTIRLDIVSDVVCPWCYIGYKRLEIAMREFRDEMRFELDWHPFELNPDMPPEGEPADAHIQRKYGIGAAEARSSRERIVGIATELGLEFYRGEDRRIYNTFDAHRVLHWARESGAQHAFNLALFQAYFEAARNPSDPDLLAETAAGLGLDGDEAREIVASERYAGEVRREEQHFLQAGISAVPAIIIDGQYLISGGQEPATFIRTFRQLAGREPPPLP